MTNVENYGELEDLAPSYDEAKAEQQAAYAQLGSAAKGVVEQIGTAVDRRQESAIAEIQDRAPGDQETSMSEVAELMDGYNDMLNAVSGEMALLAQSVSNQVQVMETNYSQLLGAMEASLPHLETHIAGRQNALQAASYSGYSGGDPIVEEENGDEDDGVGEQANVFGEEYLAIILNNLGLAPQETLDNLLTPRNADDYNMDLSQIFGTNMGAVTEQFYGDPHGPEVQVDPTTGLPLNQGTWIGGINTSPPLKPHLAHYASLYQAALNSNFTLEDAQTIAMYIVEQTWGDDEWLAEEGQLPLTPEDKADLTAWQEWTKVHTMIDNEIYFDETMINKEVFTPTLAESQDPPEDLSNQNLTLDEYEQEQTSGNIHVKAANQSARDAYYQRFIDNPETYIESYEGEPQINDRSEIDEYYQEKYGYLMDQADAEEKAFQSSQLRSTNVRKEPAVLVPEPLLTEPEQEDIPREFRRFIGF